MPRILEQFLSAIVAFALLVNVSLGFASPVHAEGEDLVNYSFFFENKDGDAGVGPVSGIVSLPAFCVTEGCTKVAAQSAIVTSGNGFANPDFIPSILDVDFTKYTGTAYIRGEAQNGSNVFTVVDGKVTFANFFGNIPRSNDKVGDFVDSLTLRLGDQGVPFDKSNPIPFLIANLSGLDDDSYPGAEGCATPDDNGDCSLDIKSITVTFERL